MIESLRLCSNVLMPDVGRGITAVFNAPTVVGPDGTLLLLPRLMSVRQKPGKIDATSGIGVYRWDPDGEITHQHSIPIAAIQGDNPLFNPEDLRIYQPDKKAGTEVLVGLTAATAEGVPYPAYLKGKLTDAQQFVITPMRVLNHLPPGKNVLPLSCEVGVYRVDGEEDNQSITFFSWEEGKIIRRTTLPPSPWVGKNGRYGLTGGRPVHSSGRDMRLLIHGLCRTENGRVIYSLGLADCKTSPDGTFDVVFVDPEPLVTYKQVNELLNLRLVKPDPKRDALYAVDCLPNGAGSIIIPISLDDQVVTMVEVTSPRIKAQFKT